MSNKKIGLLIVCVALLAAVVAAGVAAVLTTKTVTERVETKTVEVGSSKPSDNFTDSVIIDGNPLKVRKIDFEPYENTKFYRNTSGKVQHAQLILSQVGTSSQAIVHASSTFALDAYVSSSTVVTATAYDQGGFSNAATSTVDLKVIDNFIIGTSTVTLKQIIDAGVFLGTTTESRFPDGATTTARTGWFDIPPDSFLRIHLRAPIDGCSSLNPPAGVNHIAWCETATSSVKGFTLEGRLLILE